MRQSHKLSVYFACLLGACISSPDDSDGYDEPEIEGSSQALDSLTNQTVVETIDPELDLATQMAQRRASGERPLVPLAPKLVAGEGANPANHTIVRILNDAGIAEVSFLAYPPSVLGGVSVNTGTMSSRRVIVTAPLSDFTRSIRIFNDTGIFVGSVTPSSTLPAPFVIAVGDFSTANAGDEIAVASRASSSASRTIEILSSSGVLLQTLTVTQPVADDLSLSTIHTASNDLIVATFQKQKVASVIDPLSREVFNYPVPALLPQGAMFESAFPQELLVGGGAEPMYSRLTRLNFAGATTDVDVGHRENKFWVANANAPESLYLKPGSLYLSAVSTQNTGYGVCSPEGPDVNNATPAHWSNVTLPSPTEYATPGTVWNAMNTHRHPAFICPGGESVWWNAKDPATGFPRFVALSRHAVRLKPDEAFKYRAMEDNGGLRHVFSYADEPVLDAMNTYPQRAFMRQVAVHYRSQPDQTVGVEPVHEAEVLTERLEQFHEGEVLIESPSDCSVGDYNPHMIRGFRDHLIRLYGSLSHINQRMGTNFSQLSELDPPRYTTCTKPYPAPSVPLVQRGAWDRYDGNNPFFRAWVRYQRRAVNKHTRRAMTETMLAGFPAELVKTHQVATHHVNGGDHGIPNRIPPLDWTFAAGTGAGVSGYGIFYGDNNNWLSSAKKSGQKMLTLSEYNAWTADLDTAKAQARYIYDNGGQFVQVIHQTINEIPGTTPNTIDSLLSLASRGPRPGTTGGLGMVRAVSAPQLDGSKKPYNIVTIGRDMGALVERPGLLKSINQNGSFEGSVYTQPFHAHVDVLGIRPSSAMTLSTQEYNSGDIMNLNVGDQVEISFRARTNDANGKMTLVVLHDGTEMGRFRRTFSVNGNWQSYRWILRNQFPMDAVKILINSGVRDTPTGNKQTIALEDFSVVRHNERISHVDAALSDGVAHKGGVTFDVLSADFVPQATVPASFVEGRGVFSPTHAGTPIVAGGWTSMLPQTRISFSTPTLSYQLVQGSTLAHPSYAGSAFAVPAGKKIYKVTFDYMSVYDNALVVGGVMIPDAAVFWSANQWGHNYGTATLSIPHKDWVAFGLSTKASFNVVEPNWMFLVSNLQVFYH
jgi:hypothetical protein